MRIFSFAAVAAILASGVAQAADLPSLKDAPEAPILEPVAANYDWSGFYAGVHVGGAFGDVRVDPLALPFTLNTSGVIGGAHVGYNYQTGPLVLGVQAEFNGSGATASYSILGVTAKYQQDWFGSVDGRIGFAAGRALFYAIGGYAYSGIEGHLLAGGTTLYSMSDTRDGYDIGGGVEYAFTDHITARVEYRYYDFGRTTYNPGSLTQYSAHITDNIVRAGLTYKFGYEAPPVIAAKY